MNTQDTNELQDSLNELSAQSVEQSKPAETPQKQSVEIHVTGFTLFAETM
jgi:hypothetical protein